MKNTIAAIAALLFLPTLPAAAQADRCVQNYPYRVRNTAELADLRRWYNLGPGDILPDALIRLRELEVSWADRNGVGNGWVADQPNSCVLYTASSGEPVMGTRIYFLAGQQQSVTEQDTAQGETLPGSGQQALVTNGPAHIRSGPGQEHPHLRWCGIGWPLTVWPPAQDGWLRASCFDGDGWIHESLVRITDSQTRPAPAPAPVSDGAQPASGQQALVTNGPAHIRSGPGQEHPHLRWCGIGWPLTVWPPAQDGWLRASCFDGDGWIHESLVRITDSQTRPAPAPAPVSDGAQPASGQQALVTNGPAHIRSGPGQEHPHLRWCGIGWSLTVWPPSLDGWLRASCYGGNGWIHESLVQILD